MEIILGMLGETELKSIYSKASMVGIIKLNTLCIGMAMASSITRFLKASLDLTFMMEVSILLEFGGLRTSIFFISIMKRLGGHLMAVLAK